MAFCKNCGAENEPNAKFCPNCGQPNIPQPSIYDTNVNGNISDFGGQQNSYYNGQANGTRQQPMHPMPPSQQLNSLALVGFILSLVMAFLGLFLCGVGIVEIPSLVISIVGLVQVKKSNPPQSGKGFAIAGIIISAVVIVLWVLFWIAFIAFGLLNSNSPSFSYYSSY